MRTKKMIRLINNERVGARAISAKGCDSSSTDHCYYEDNAQCQVYSIDICSTKDLAGCYSHAEDVCSGELDIAACVYGNEDYT